MGLVGGLALFLYGMEKMTAALKLVAGQRMRHILARMTTNRFRAVFAGAFITATIQSSSVTTVLVVGFISAGLLSLSQSIGIIMGAEIGTTITAQIIAFKVTKYSLLLVAGGFALQFASRSERWRHYGRVVMGLGLIFFGMQLMKEATSPLRDYEPFIETMRDLRNPLLAVLFSALFTAAIQSSSATTGIIIVLASQGFVDLETGIALVFGANIGTCVTAYLASIGKPREAVRAATVHILFNSIGVAIWLGLIPVLADVIREISPVAEGAIGIEKLKAETPRQIANAHTAFNVSNTLVFIGFTPLFARLVEWLIPDRPTVAEPRKHLQHLEKLVGETPGLALGVVAVELGRLGDSALDMVRATPEPVLRGSEADLERLRRMDDAIDERHGDLVSFLARLSLESLSTAASQRVSASLAAANYLENIGDMIETNVVEAGLRRVHEGVEVSEGTEALLRELHEKVLWAVETASKAFVAWDPEKAMSVLDAKAEVSRLADEAAGHLARRLSADAPHRLDAFRVESELVEAFRRVYYFAKRIAKLVVEHEKSGVSARQAKPDEAAAEIADVVG